MKPLLSTLPPDTIQTLITWCETERTYAAVSQRAAKPIAEGGLNLRISAPTLNRLYTTHNIADSKEARAQYAASLGADCKRLRLLQATRENIEQRLFEITSRPDATVAELRLAAQFIQRADSLSLSQRRVRVAEKREARIAEQTAPEPPPTPQESKRRIQILFGKDFGQDSKPQTANPPAPEPTNSAREVTPSSVPSACPATAEMPSVVKTTPPPPPQPPAHPAETINPKLPIVPIIPISTIQAAAQLHANRSYPDHLRPACPIYRKIFDEGKQHCLQQRILAETENWLKTQTQDPNAMPPSQTVAADGPSVYLPPFGAKLTHE